MSDSHLFRIEVLEGKGFGSKVDAVHVEASFAGETKVTPYSVGAGVHTWHSKLQWSITTAQLRRLSSNGQYICKVAVSNREGARLGWLVLDLRSARLQSQYKTDSGGHWALLSGARKGEAPQLRLTCELVAERLIVPDVEPPSKPAKQSLRKNKTVKAADPPVDNSSVAVPPATAAAAANVSPAAMDEDGSRVDYDNDFEEDDEGAGGSGTASGSGSGTQDSGGTQARRRTSETPSRSGSAVGASSSAGRGSSGRRLGGEGSTAAAPAAAGGTGPVTSSSTATVGAAGAAAAVAAADARRAAASPSGGGSGGPAAVSTADPLARLFALTIDLRSFQGAAKLPLNLASVYVLAVMPPEIIELVVRSGRRLPSRMAPMKTHPAVDVARGAEGALPNGHGTVEFTAGVMELARSLARDLRITAEVWHKEKFRSDSLLGVASVPLTPLLQDAWVDGVAPVHAMVTTSGTASDNAPPAAKLQVGLLRVVLSLEDKGPAPPLATSQVATAVTPDTPGPNAVVTEPSSSSRLPLPRDGSTRGGVTPADDAPARPRAVTAGPPAGSSAAVVAAALGGRDAQRVGAVHEMPEFEAAYELEVWKKGEESRWRAELRDREAQRMSLLEAEWRRRERGREAEAAALRAEYATLQERTREVLLATEDRERRLVAAEEALARRRRDLEREHAARMNEAEAAVRRLQIECEHQLEIERDRNADLARQRSALEERVAVAEARGAGLERAFADFREQARAAPAARQAEELQEARSALRQAEERAGQLRHAVDRATRSKAAYKAQVVKLAEQLASLYKQQQHTERLGLEARRADVDSNALRLAAEKEARYSLTQQQELARLRIQLQTLKNSALAAVSPSTSPVRRWDGAAGEAAAAAAGPGSATDASLQGMLDGAARGAAAAAASVTLGDTRDSDQQKGMVTPGGSPTKFGRPMPSAHSPPPGDATVTQRTIFATQTTVTHSADPTAAATTPPSGAPWLYAQQQQQHGGQQQQQGGQQAPDRGGRELGGTPGSPRAGAEPQPRSSPNAAELGEIRRLLQRKAELLQTGAYRPDDALLIKIDQRVAELGKVQGR